MVKTAFDAAATTEPRDNFTPLSVTGPNGQSQTVQWSLGFTEIAGQDHHYVAQNIKIQFQGGDGNPHEMTFKPSGRIAGGAIFDGQTPRTFFFAPASVDGQMIDSASGSVINQNTGMPGTMTQEQIQTLFREGSQIASAVTATAPDFAQSNLTVKIRDSSAQTATSAPAPPSGTAGPGGQ